MEKQWWKNNDMAFVNQNGCKWRYILLKFAAAYCFFILQFLQSMLFVFHAVMRVFLPSLLPYVSFMAVWSKHPVQYQNVFGRNGLGCKNVCAVCCHCKMRLCFFDAVYVLLGVYLYCNGVVQKPPYQGISVNTKCRSSTAIKNK